MPLIRAEVRNEYGLGQPELYKKVNREDPKAILDGVVVAGLVGILRQLGDLAEFAAEVFHGLQEQVMSTASRSHKLSTRVQRIEAALPPLEKAVLGQTSHIHFAYTAGSEWHPRINNEKNHFIYNDLPRFIMDSYEVCRDPPRLHLLDKFDAGGPGSCLKRYSDPTYFKRVSNCSVEEDEKKVPRDKKTRKSKKRRSSHKNGELSRGASLSNRSGRMQFTSPIVNGQTSSSRTASTVDMAPKSDLGEHSNSFDSRNGSGYIECVLNLGSSILPEEQEPKEVSSRLMQETDTLSSDFPIEQTRIIDDRFSHSSSQEQIAPNSSCVTWDEKAEILELKAGNWDRDAVTDMNCDVDVQETAAANLGNGDEMDIPFNDMDAPLSSSIENLNDEIESEPDNYMDALNTIDSESENDIECRRKRGVEQCSENDVECHTKQEVEQSSENDAECRTKQEVELCSENDVECHTNQEVEQCSENDVECHTKQEVEQCSENDVECQTKWEVEQSNDANNVNNNNREDGLAVVTDDNADHHPSIIEPFALSNITSSSGISMSLPDPVPSENFDNEQTPPISRKSSDPDHSPSTGLCTSDEICNGSQADSVISDPSSASSIVSDMHEPGNDRIISSVGDSQNSQNEFSGVHPVGFWTNGGLLGLEPSKPPDFAVSTTRQASAAKNSEDFDPQNQTLMALHNGPKGNSAMVVENSKSIEKGPVSCSEKASLPDEENNDNSFGMFGLGHKLLVSGFRRKVSIGHDGESESATSIKSGVPEQRNGHHSISCQQTPWTTFNEQIGNGSPVNSLASSPPLEHMKISFNPIDGFETSKLRLQFPDRNHYQESVRDMFPSFQLVPVPTIPVHDVASNSDDDTFCRLSLYTSDDCLSNCSESNSEVWESGETPESKDPELYDALSRLSSMESVSSFLQVGEAVNNGIHVNGGNKAFFIENGMKPSLLVSLDLPSFEAINPVVPDETKMNSDEKNQLELQNPTEVTPLPPSAPPPAQWRVSKPCLDEAEERQHALSESLRHERDLKLLGSTVSQKPKPPSVNRLQIKDEAIALKPKKSVDQEKLNTRKEASQLSSGRGMDENEDFSLQIRTKSFNLRPTVTARPTVTSGPAANFKVTAILQKANAIRQAVGNDDGDGDDDDNWSDT
ncbi:hypothetical protein PTKIN_Ptkin18bG0112000 [Pterospermum kingtungense]